MKLLDNYDPIVGDDLGYRTPRLNQIPEGFGFSALEKHTDCPLTNEKWETLIDFASRYYRHFEIVGLTYKDFQDNLQLAYDIGADTMERLLEVYNDDIAKPILGRTEKVTYDTKNTATGGYEDSEDTTVEGTTENDNTTTNNLTTAYESEGQTDNIDVPVDSSSPNTQTPSQVTKNSGNDTTTNTGTVKNEGSVTENNSTNRKLKHTDDSTNAQTGTVTTELSDLGVRPNYESLNGFLDNNRTYLEVFVWLFRDCFSFNEVYTW